MRLPTAGVHPGRLLRSALGFGQAARALFDAPVPEGEVAVPKGKGELLAPGEPFRVLCWNVQYCAGRTRRFFYDGGHDVAASPAEVEATLTGVAALVRRWKPDLVLLQEVDRGADRTGRVDQHRRLADALDLPVDLSAAYHHVRYVPHPPHAHLGRVDMHLSIFSRFQLTRAARIHLPLLRESWLRRRFNLRRILLEVEVATQDGPPLRVFNTHLSAFSFGDGSLEQQVARCVTAADEAETRSGRWLLAGDFNALPPGDVPSRLGADSALYPEATPPIRGLTDRFATPAMPPRPDQRSWVPWGSKTADRQLDWLFLGRALEALEHRVDPHGADWSDHLPLVTEVVLA